MKKLPAILSLALILCVGALAGQAAAEPAPIEAESAAERDETEHALETCLALKGDSRVRKLDALKKEPDDCSVV